MGEQLAKQGLAEIEINGDKTVLVGSFENMAMFEQTTGIGIYKFIGRLQSNDLHVTDFVNMIWAFSADRDKAGWTKQEIFQKVFGSDPKVILATIGAFISLLFGQTEEGDAPTEETKTSEKKI